MITIAEVQHLSDVHPEEVFSLLRQLTDTPQSFTKKELEEIITNTNSHLFIAKENEKLVGMLTVGYYMSPTGKKAWVEDVVVDANHRGNGCAKKLVEHAIGFVKQKQIPLLQLTSNPKRIEANHLYPRIGFEKKETNVYKMKF